MVRLTILFIGAMMLMTATVVAQDFDWAVQSMNAEGGSANGADAAFDSQGNMYVVGDYDGHVAFGMYDLGFENNFGTMYVAKYNSIGEIQWLRGINGNSNNHMYNVAVIDDDQIIVSGEYQQTNDLTILDFGEFQMEGLLEPSMFLAIINGDGEWQWANAMFSEDDVGQQYILPEDMVVTSAGDIYIFGEAETPTLTYDAQVFVTDGEYGWFLARFNIDGELEWFEKGDGWLTDVELALGSDDRIYMAGRLLGEAGYKGEILESTGSGDVMIAAVGTDSNLAWWQVVGHQSFDESPHGIDLDAENSVYLAFNNPYYVFIDGVEFYNETGSNQFLYKFDSEGSFQWGKPILSGLEGGVAGGILTDEIVVTPDGQSFVSGRMESPNWWGNPIFFGDTIGGFGWWEGCISTYDAQGNYLDVVGFGFDENNTNGEFRPSQMKFDPDGNLVITGEFRDELDLESVTLITEGSKHMFAIKMDPSEVFDSSTDVASVENGPLLLYPNPFNQSITIDGEWTGAQVTLFNTLGELTHSQQLSRNGQIDLSHLENGMYVLTVILNHQQFSTRIIKN